MQGIVASTEVVGEAFSVVNVIVAIIGWIIVAEGLLGITRLADPIVVRRGYRFGRTIGLFRIMQENEERIRLLNRHPLARA